MAQPFLGQIELFAFGFAPRGWMVCAGQTLGITQNQALFALLGTTYGGDGRTTFALPDLRGSAAVGQGSGQGLSPWTIGQTGGVESVTLTSAETPTHGHGLAAISNPDTTANVATPSPAVLLTQTTGVDAAGGPLVFNIYATDAGPTQGQAPTQALSPASVGMVGGTPHSNMMPSAALNFCISLMGAFPSRN